jgi:proteasome lid subunit RPN8/RPN11
MLGGRGTRAIRVVPLRNRAADPHAFFADPYEQFLAERLFARVGLKIVALYHSHPGGGALPSDADREFSAAWPCAQVIIASPGTDRGAPDLRAYRWAEGGLREVPIQP